jgi:hypothetical protein
MLQYYQDDVASGAPSFISNLNLSSNSSPGLVINSNRISVPWLVHFYKTVPTMVHIYFGLSYHIPK